MVAFLFPQVPKVKKALRGTVGGRHKREEIWGYMYMYR